MVLLTGHTGFKGSLAWVVVDRNGCKGLRHWLEARHRSNLFSQLQLGERLEGNHFLDIRNFQSLNSIIQEFNPEIVFHSSSPATGKQSYIDPIGTWEVNVQGTLHLLEALKSIQRPCSAVMVTTDKVYANKEWDFGYRESDRLGGHDP